MKRTEQGALNRNFPSKSGCGVKVKIRTLAPMHLRRKVNETGFRSISLDRNDLKHCSKESTLCICTDTIKLMQIGVALPARKVYLVPQVLGAVPPLL